MTPNKQITIWLILSAFMVIIMVFIGGWTRLSDAGLSIVEWKPVTGIFPPIEDSDWEMEFGKYKESPEFEKLHNHFTLGDFKGIFWLEFIHRILGRMTGIIILLPALFFWYKGYLRDWKPYVSMVLLVGFQGFMGWWMVKSGLVDNPHVSHFRLAAHLITAFMLYSVIFWEIMVVTGQWYATSGEDLHYSVANMGSIRAHRHREFRRNAATQFLRLGSVVSGLLRRLWLLAMTRQTSITTEDAQFKIMHYLPYFSLILLFFQIFLGGLVAGLDAGMIYNSFPLMGNHFVPSEFELSWQMLYDPASVQFLHRCFAYLVAIILFILAYSIRSRMKYISIMLILAVFAQILLGVLTIIYVVPMNLALAHQLFAVLLLSLVLNVIKRGKYG